MTEKSEYCINVPRTFVQDNVGFNTFFSSNILNSQEPHEGKHFIYK